jgi:DNA repair protein RadC
MAEQKADAASSGAGHRQRLRTRFLKAPESLPDYEILELLLCMAQPRIDTKPLAKNLIKNFGDLSRALAAHPSDLAKIDGIGEAGITALKLVQEASARLARAQVIDRPVISSWDKLIDYCRIAMGGGNTEQFRLIFLDRKNVVIGDEVQQKGTVDHTPLYPREVVKRALDLSASAVIMVHNHPSGDPSPSRSDIDMTRQVQDALKAVGIQLHDHVVIGRSGHVSMKSSGLI